MLKIKWLVSSVIFMSFISVKTHAQFYANMYGTGMTMGMNACPYQISLGDEAESIQDGMREQKEAVAEINEKLTEAKKKERETKRDLDHAQRDFSRSGYKKDGKVWTFISSHLEHRYTCDNYAATRGPHCAEAGPAPSEPPKQDCSKIKNKDEKAACQTAREDYKSAMEAYKAKVAENKKCQGQPKTADVSSAPYEASEVGAVCTNNPGELVASGLCRLDKEDKTSGFKSDACADALSRWQKSDKEHREAQSLVDQLKEQLKVAKDSMKDMKKDLRRAVKDHLQDLRDGNGSDTEGGVCVECMMAGNGAVYKKPSGGEILGQLALGLGAMYFGNQLNSQIADKNAQLGFATQPTPAFGYGFPYFMGALYGAVGGGVASGGFGCGAGGSGGGYPMGPYGMMGPFGMTGGYNPMGGAFGYPSGMYPSPVGGGMFMPGMGSWGGIPGPMGLDFGMNMNPYAMMNPYGMNQMGMYNPMSMGGGMNMNPYAMMNPYGMNQMGMNPMMGGMNPMMGMYNPMSMGGGMNMNPYAMMNPMSMYNPMMGGMNPMMNGMYNPMMMNPMMNPMNNNMQMYMQQMQMQMQAQQAYMQAQMQAQQKYQQNYMASQQVISGLTQQMNQIAMQIQQVQMSMYTGGSMGYYMGPQYNYNNGTNNPGSGGINQTYMPGVNTTPATNGTQSIR